MAAIVMLAASAVPASAQTPVKKDATTGPNVRDHRGLRVQITMDHMHCIKTTERNIFNKSDEVYLIVAGKAPSGDFKKRLPGQKDHYSFKNGQKAAQTGWKNKSGKEVGRPVIWAGN